MLQCFIRLDKIELFLPFIILDLLLVNEYLVSQVIEELLVLAALDLLESIGPLLLVVDLVDDVREELLVVSLAGVELDPLREPLACASLNEGGEERVGHFLLVYLILEGRRRVGVTLGIPGVRGVLLPHAVLHPVLRFENRLLRGTAT